MKGRLNAKKKPLARQRPQPPGNALEKIRLKVPSESAHQVEILGRGPEGAVKAVEVLQRLGVI
jgi:hypothetical protein